MSSAVCRSPYFMTRGKSDFVKFWGEYLSSERSVLYILALGFDPRTLDCVGMLNDAAPGSDIRYRVIRYDEREQGEEGDDYASSLQVRNEEAMACVIPESKREEARVRMGQGGDQATAVDALRNCARDEDFERYTDIVVDISAMPPDVYFPALKKILGCTRPAAPGAGVVSVAEPGQRSAGAAPTPSVYVVASENAELDSAITPAGLGEQSSYMHALSGDLHLESQRHRPKVWMPVLGSGRGAQLKKIYQDVQPDAAAPVLPHPSADPYRAQKTLLEYREILFDSLGMDSASFVYAHEANPFETCRRISDTATRYSKSFGILDGCHVVLSPLSNKMQGLGCLMAAMDLSTAGQSAGIAYVENRSYRLGVGGEAIEEMSRRSMPVVAALSGECYDK